MPAPIRYTESMFTRSRLILLIVLTLALVGCEAANTDATLEVIITTTPALPTPTTGVGTAQPTLLTQQPTALTTPGMTPTVAPAVEVMSPDGAHSIILEPPGTLILQTCAECEPVQLATAPEIDDVVWFPDGAHIVYTVVDRSAQTAPELFYQATRILWVADVNTGETAQISEADENLHHPVVSPDSQQIAVIAGSGFGDGGRIDWALAFIQLNEAGLRSSILYQSDFDGIPPASEDTIHPITIGDLTEPGIWLSDTEFQSALQVSFGVDGFTPGIYTFDLDAMTVTKTGDLPA
jgi:hypothetical protein